MTVHQLIKALKTEIKYGNRNIEVRMFAHDQDPYQSDEGEGTITSVEEIVNNDGEIFISLHA